MAVIGTLMSTRDGGWAGPIVVMMSKLKVRLVPNDNRGTENAPAFRVYAGPYELGAAWEQKTSGENPRDYRGARLDGPGLVEPISVAIFFGEGGKTAQIVWSRRAKHASSE
jgi:uncharacterized protein (DUF736 family)